MSEKYGFSDDSLETSNILESGLTPFSEIDNLDSKIEGDSSYVDPIERELESLESVVQNISQLDESPLANTSELLLFEQSPPLTLDPAVADEEQSAALDSLTGSPLATVSTSNLNESFFSNGESSRITLKFIQRETDWSNEVGLYRVDDARGRIGELLPGDKGYSSAALDPARSIITLDNGAASVQFSAAIEPNILFGSYLIQNDTSQKYLEKNSSNQLDKKPLAFFSFSEGNPDNFDHLQTRVNDSGSIDLGWSDGTNGGEQDFTDSVFTISFGDAPINNTPSNYAVRAEGKLKLRGRGDYDGDPKDLDDDVLIYAGAGFDLAGRPILPVKRDEAGNPLVDGQNKQILVDDAIAVAPGYSTGKATQSIKHLLSGLTPPQMVDKQIVDVPEYSVIKQELLETTINDASSEVTLPALTRLNNASRWSSNFPAPGTTDNPTVVRVQRQGLTIPHQVDLSNYVIIVEQGDIKFQGSQHQLDNVVLVAESGKIDLGQAEVKDSSLLAAKSIFVRSDTNFVGDNLIANSQGKIEFHSSQSELEAEDLVRVIAAGDLSIKGRSTLKGEFLTQQDFLAQGRTSVYGSVGAKGDVTFNGRVEMHAIPNQIKEIRATIDTTSVTEDSGLSIVTVTLDAPAEETVTVDFATRSDTAQAGSDYQEVNGTISFAPGETVKTIEIPLLNDGIYEADEALVLELTNPQGMILERDSIVVSIINDDPVPEIVIDHPSFTELDTETGNMIFTVSLSNPSSFPVTVDYATEDDTAAAGSDYQAQTGTLTFEPGELEKTIEIPIIGDLEFEPDETFKLNLSNPINGVLSEEESIGTGTINNNDLSLLELNLNLTNDTGVNNTDNISSDGTVSGSIINQQGEISLSASFDDSNPTDFSDKVQPDGSFTLGMEQLEQLNGGDLSDGSYTLYLVATDSGSGVVRNSSLTFVLDKTAPTLELTTPLVDGDHSSRPRLIGNTDNSNIDSVSYSLDGELAKVITVDDNGNFDDNLDKENLNLGTHSVTVTATDIAGNQSQREVSFQVGDNFFNPNATNGWGAQNDSTLILGEQDSYVVETSIPVALGLETNEDGEQLGTRTISFDLDAVWDDLDQRGIEDQLLVYLVDPANPSQTLLDNGSEGTAVFSLAGEQSDFTPGLVGFDGSTVTIDASSLTDVTEGLLVFQLLNQDDDTGSIVTVNNLASTTDLEGFQDPVFPEDNTSVPIGEALNLDNLTVATDVETIIENVRFNSSTGEYRAEVSIQNNGEAAISRNTVVLFNDLPDGVELSSPNGTDSAGNPYLNLRLAILPGGLDLGGVSDVVEVVFTNPNLIRFGLNPTVLVGSPNVAPVLEPIGNLTVTPGEKLAIPLTATDIDEDTVTYKLQADGDLPTGMLDGSGTLKFNPQPDEIGSYEFTIIATDGAESVSQTVTLDVVADPITTTRISGVIENVEQEPLAGVVIELGDLETVTLADGSFTIETDQPLTDDTLKVRGESIEGDQVYPFIAEKLPLVLGTDVYEGFHNYIDRPIYLPALDVASGQVIDKDVDATVTTENIPGASVFVEAGSLSTQEGETFTGTLSITEVPTDLTPAALPENLSPDMVVTIQPGEMVFNTPAPLSLPNRAGWAAGMEMDLWSINPETGDFDKVGMGRVSDDGSVVETIEGGIRNSSWHFFAPQPISPNHNNPPPDCNECQETDIWKSQVEFNSGAVIENYDLVPYTSSGESRGISLTYDSLRADPRPIVKLDYGNIKPRSLSPQVLLGNLRIIADLQIEGNGIDYQVPGGDENNHFWSISEQSGNANISLQADLKEFSSGKYDYKFTNGVYLFAQLQSGIQVNGSSKIFEDKILHVNSINSAFGSGWGIAGWQEIVENSDGSVLLIDGDGSELWFDAPENEGEPYINPPGDYSVLEKSLDGTFRRTTKDLIVYDFNENSQLASETDTNENSTKYIYDGRERLVKIIDPVGLETVLTYDSAGKVSSIIDPAQRETLIEYDSSGNLISITNPDRSNSQWEYDNGHHMVREIDPEGNRAEATYDQFGRAKSATQEDGSVVRVDPVETQGLYSPNATVNLYSAPNVWRVSDDTTTAYADANGNVTSTKLDLSGQKISSNDGAGQTNSIKRNEDNLIASQTNSRGFETEYIYDDRGNVIQTSEDLFSAGLVEETESEQFFPDPRYKVDGADVLASGDLNFDGLEDIVTNGSVLLGTENGTFDSRIDYEPIRNTNKILLKDVDADTKADLILLGQSGISVFSGNGDGTFGENTYVYSNTSSRVAAIAGTIDDFNQDGILDLVAFNSDGIISQHIGDGNGNFVLESEHQIEADNNQFASFTNQSFDSLVFEDLDRDRDLDLIIGFPSNETHQVRTYSNNNDGTFTIQDNILLDEVSFGTGASTAVPKLADLNNDNIPDLIVSYGYYKYIGRSTPPISRVETSVLLGKGDGTFELNNNYVLENLSKSNSQIEISDLNNDGNLDLIQSDGRQFSIQLGNGTGDFEPPQYYYSGNLIRSFQVKDWNNDGYLDVGSVDGRESFSVQFNQGDGTFDTYFHLDLGNSLPNKDIEDLNSDGLPDLFGTIYNDSTRQTNLAVATGNGDGSFDPFTEIDIELPSGMRFSSYALEDIRGNENSDIILFSNRREYSANSNSYITTTTLSTFVGIENGVFDDRTDYVIKNNVSQILLVKDINGDSNLDIIARRLDGYLLLLNNGDGSFSEQILESDFSFNPNLSLADLDGDQDLDLLDSTRILFNDGDGNFTGNTTIPLGEEYNLGLTHVEDLNGDGNLDIVANTYKPFDNSERSVSTWLGNGDGTFQNRIVYNPDARTFGYLSYLIKLGDLNLDGIVDLIGGQYNDNSANSLSNNVFVALGNGDGTFGRETNYSITGNASSISLADLDDDDDLDLLFGYYLSNISSSDSGLPRTGITSKLNQSNRSNSKSTLAESFYTYDSTFNQVTSETDELGRQTNYDIDPNNGNLLSTTKVVGEVGGDDDVTNSYSYTDAGLIETMTDPEGRVTDYDYDEFGRLIKETYAFGTADEASISYEYDRAGNQTATVDENGNRTEFEYDSLNRLIKSTYAVDTPDEAVETTEYDRNGNQIETVDGLGNRTEYKYDEFGRLIETIFPDPDGNGVLTNPVTTSTYDGVGNLIATTDPLGRETRYVYDSRNRLVKTILPDGTTTKSKYDTDNNLVSTIDAAGETSNKIYDARGRLIRETDAQGNITRYQYDAADQLIAIIDGNDNRTEYQYDELGRQISVTDGFGNVNRTEYDKVGNVVATVDGNGNRTEYEFDERDRNTQVTDAEGGTTTTEYDDVGNVVSVTDPVNNQTSYTYDAQNRVTSETNELGFTRTFEYDNNGNSISTTDRNGRTREFSFDGLNRQVEENWLDDAGNSIRTINSEYDSASQLVATDDPDSAYTFTYDELGRLMTVDNAGTPGVPNVVLTYNYDAEGNIISVSDTIDGETGATTAYNYDELDRVDRITQSVPNVADKRVDFAYDAIGQYESITRYSDPLGTDLVAESSYTYDKSNRLTNLNHSNSTTEIANYDLTYDAASRITQIVDADGTNDYSYDKRDQLTAAEHSDESNADETYNYDKNGNRVSSSLHGSGYVTDANNRLESDGTYNYEYDQSGNLISQTEIATGKVQEFTWDYLNRLVVVVDKDNAGNEVQKVEFTYDMFGRRLSKTVNGEAIYFVYDRDNVILDFVDADGIERAEEAELEQRYLHGERVDQVLAQENGAGDVAWHLADHLGSVRDLVDNSGNAVNHYVYDSFGNVVSETDDTVDTRYLYTGREWDDEIGLQYNRARYYNPESGRLINEDPIEFDAGDSNLYRYVANNPLNYTDPFGLQSRPRYPLGHDHPDCIVLAKQIESLDRTIKEKQEEFRLDDCNLPGKTPNDHLNDNPASSRRGHKNKLDFLKAKRAEKIALYQARCGEYPVQEPQSQSRNNFDLDIPDWLRTIGSVIGGIGRAAGGLFIPQPRH